MILALLATLGAIVTAFVLYPVFKGAPASGVPEPVEIDEIDLELSDLIDKKAMLYDAMQDLDFEKDSGKISASDYESARSDYMAQVSAVMKELDALAPQKTRQKEDAEEKPVPSQRPRRRPQM